MNKDEQELYRQEYARQKESGIPFFPQAVFKDVVVVLLVFIAIVLVAGLVGASLEEIADPGDASYTPRPEWYFLFLFQLLKYFPGDLEVVGVFVIPVVLLTLLVALPWLDRSSKRHWSGRPVVMAVTVVLLAGAAFLTVRALTAAAPPAEATAAGDQTAKLYADNCAGCHGSTVVTEPGVDVFAVIQGGTHEGMPAWNSDLTDAEIDSLVGFILEPNGHALFLDNCSECHDSQSLTEADAVDLRRALEQGPAFEPHAGLDLPAWSETLSVSDQARLLNFLTAPDGQRVWTQECSSCHGSSVAYEGDADALEEIIREGGGHLEMPAFEGALDPADIDTLARYVSDPPSAPEGPALFGLHCAQCHSNRVLLAPDYETAKTLISLGGAHEEMPVWGDILTDEQIDALVGYVLTAAELPDLNEAERLYLQNCAACHGNQGEGGPNPTRAGDIIAPISSAEYLATRDDATLRSIISQGQPNFGMSPFGDAFGGPLTSDQIDLLVAYLRSWEENPPVELPPEVPTSPGGVQDAEGLFQTLCSQCHGEFGEGGVGPAFDAAWQGSKTDLEIFDDINLGHPATPMIAWGEVLSSSQIADLVDYIRTLTGQPTASASLTYEGAIRPIFVAHCAACHGSLGGWTATSYEQAISTGEGGPTIIPGDPDNSRLVQTLIGTHPDGMVMPPSGSLDEADIQKIIDWVEAGAPER
jgi:mono/diheme cytochrome c family protein